MIRERELFGVRGVAIYIIIYIETLELEQKISTTTDSKARFTYKLVD